MQLDLQKLEGFDTLEKKQLYFFQYLSTLETRILKSKQENQAEIEQSLLKYLKELAPGNKPIYTLIGRCLVGIYQTGELRSLYEVSSSLLNSFSIAKELELKSCLINCIGTLMESHGSKIMSLAPEALSLCMKAFKAVKDTELTIRYECLRAVAKICKGAGLFVSETSAKEYYKAAKYCLSDKHYIIRVAAAEAMDSLFLNCKVSNFTTLAEYESAINSLLKHSAGQNRHVRRSIATLIATVLNKSTQPGSPSKGTKDQTPQKYTVNMNELFSFLPKLYLKVSSLEGRLALVESYSILCKSSGIEFVESNYQLICDSTLMLLADSKLTKADFLIAKESAKFLLREVVGKMLSESGQLRACRSLIKRIAGAEKSEFSISVYGCVLNELGSLLTDLGPAALPLEEDLVEPLLDLVDSEQFHLISIPVASCMRDLALAIPNHITKIMNKLLVLIQQTMTSFDSSNQTCMEKALAYGHVLSAVIGIIRERSLYAAYEDAGIIFGLALKLINAKAEKNYALATCQVSLGWTLVGSLLTLGPNFVNVHLSQLIQAWQLVFVKPPPRDNAVARSELEMKHMIFTREAAIAAMFSFIKNNPAYLKNEDEARQILVFLNNSLLFLAFLPGQYEPLDEKPPTACQIALFESECALRQRLYGCFRYLDPALYEAIYTPLLKSLVDCFAMNPEKADRFLATLGTKDGAFFGKIGGKDTGALCIESIQVSSIRLASNNTIAKESGAEERSLASLSIFDGHMQLLERIIDESVFPSLEFDAHCLYLNGQRIITGSVDSENVESTIDLPVHPSVAVVNSAIELFSILFPLQNESTQETVIEHLVNAATFNSGRMTPIRKSACRYNSLVALTGSLKYISAKKGKLCNPAFAGTIRDLALQFVSSENVQLRMAAGEILGRVCRVTSNPAFVTALFQVLIDQVVNNREPEGRAGACFAQGAIYNFIGGIAAGSQLKTTISILHSLAADPHPLVHTWALHALYLIIESSGLMYGTYVNSTLSLITKLYMSESHDLTALAANTGTDDNSEVSVALGRILYGLVGVIGPELDSSPKLREMCFDLFEQFKNDSNPFVVVEAIKCIQNFIMFAPKHIDIPTIIPYLQKRLQFENKSTVTVVRTAAITCLYQLTQRDPGLVLDSSVDNCLEEQLFSLIDLEMEQGIRDEIKDILHALLKHVSRQSPSRWIDLCKQILLKSAGMNEKNAVQDTIQPETDDPDEEAVPEVPKPKVQLTTSSNLISVLLLPRWRTQVFSLECVEKVIDVVLQKNEPADFDLELALQKKDKLDYLVFRLGDLIRLAFNSSTASVSFLKLSGLKLLRKILDNYSHAREPDFPEHSLLQQYEAQIISAIAPGFEVGASPKITTAACRICADVLISGILEGISSNSRPVRFLFSLQSQFLGTETKTNGRTPSSNVVVKLAITSALSRFYISPISKYLRDSLFSSILQEFITLGLQCLFEYSRLAYNIDGEGGIDSHYGLAARGVTLPFYELSWIEISGAIAFAIHENPKQKWIIKQNDEIPTEVSVVIGLLARGISNNSDPQGKVVCLHSLELLLSSILFETAIPKGLVNELLMIINQICQQDSLAVQVAAIKFLACLQKRLIDFAHPEKYNTFIEKIAELTIKSCNTNLDSLITSKKSENSSVFDMICDLLESALDILIEVMQSDISITSKKEIISLTLVCLIKSFGIEKIMKMIGSQLLSKFKRLLNDVQLLFSDQQAAVMIQGLLSYLLARLFKSESNKNTILAVVLVITVCPRESYQPKFQQRIYAAVELLLNHAEVEMQVFAIQSIKAMILLSAKEDMKIAHIGTYYARLFLPLVVSHLFNSIEDGRDCGPLYDETLKLFLQLVSAQNIPRLKSQTIVLLVQCLNQMASDLGHENAYASMIGTIFLQLATQEQTFFKASVSSLDEHAKTSLEILLKKTIQSNANAVKYSPEQATPKIQLKSFT